MTWWLPWHSDWWVNAGALLLAIALDALLPEPPNALHPVVWMGKVIAALERLADGRGDTAAFLIGAMMAIVVPAVFCGAAWLAVIGLREIGDMPHLRDIAYLRDLPYLLGGAILLKTTFAVRGLGQAARDTQRSIEGDDVDEARHSLRSLVSRDAATLSEPLVAAAAIESVAENTTDSYIAPWLAFALLGVPGAFAYRAANTLDSMVGYRGKYEYLGKASARIDDLLNLIPARISAILLIIAGALSGHNAAQGCRTVWQQRHLTDSPNAGWTIAAMAGLLGVALEKPEHYRIGSTYREPTATDIGRTVNLAYIVAAVGAAVVVGVMALVAAVAG